MRRLSASLEVFGADEVTLVGLGHTAMRADPVPPAPPRCPITHSRYSVTRIANQAAVRHAPGGCAREGCGTVRHDSGRTRGTGREYQVPPAPRSLARKDESIVVGDAVVVRALVIDRQRLAIRRDDPMHGANDLPSLRERKVPCPGINRLWRHAVGVWVAGNRIALAVGLVGHVHRCFLAVGTDGFAVKR